MNPAPHPELGPVARGRLPGGFWVAVLALFAVVVSLRTGLWHPTATVRFGGVAVTIPNGFASVDHPFHASRAEELLRTLRAGGLLRWVDNHQGGYPVEFYPLGAAWLDLGVWAASLGSLPMAAAHSIAVVLVLLLPVVGFVLLSRRDRMPLAVAVLALVAHAVVPGGWYGGGYTELVQWGLVTNVAAGAALFVAFGLSLPWVEYGNRLALAGAGLAGAFALCTNPRSFVAFGAAGVGILAASVLPGRRAVSTAIVVLRLALAAGLMLLLAAPEVVSLVRFSRFYAFVQYSSYPTAGDWLRASAESVTWPILVVGTLGAAIGLVSPRWPAMRATAATLAAYVALTLAFVDGSPLRRLVPQLEATRLMPFQRLLTLALAAGAIWVAGTWLAERTGRARQWPVELAVGTLTVVLAVWWLRPGLDSVPDPALPMPPARGLYMVATSGVPQQADLEAAVRAADAAAAPGTALLVAGSALSWHQQLWAPFWTDRPLFYDNWLWYWDAHHAGTPGYRPELGNAYPDLAATLDPSYLAAHGIGAVVATGPVAAAAVSDAGLTPIRSGTYGAWRVNAPTSIVTVGAARLDVASGNGRLVAGGTSPGGTALVRRNWFPRWQATVNGKPVTIARTASNEMEVAVPPGRVTIVLEYGVDVVDWLARLASVVGVAATGWLVATRGRGRRPAQAGGGTQAR